MMNSIKLLKFLLILVLSSTISYSQTITKDSDLTFPGVISDSNTIIVVTPSMNGFAAEFEFQSDPSTAVTVTVEGGGVPTCEIITGGGWLSDWFSNLMCEWNNTGITFRDFTFGGDLNTNGTGTTDSILGRLNIKIGGTADIPGGALSGEFQDNLTLRVTGSGINETISFLARIISSSNLSITIAKGIEFPITEQLPSSQNIVVSASDPGAAVFHVIGDPYDSITASLPSSASITNGSNVITLNTFLFGGGFNTSGNGTLDNEGNITGYIGATANVPANPSAGTYTGTITLTVVRN
ncbi:MAG: DUF4402 domain-containing protein [Desulfobacterales bacterium]|nr:DUF4402 domain-containing protein [Desulfobacterales bacterium]